ncbi:hypothetical protein [Paenibacillus sp. J22TS3]|uniref:hypothetical protein n=1 Tax=Paenibacillus sp. J22TS3 TaxID=2807192 RepID=UPI001BCDC372|nr:hypothetical protein [Paenibacillus sp. J22TS3]
MWHSRSLGAIAQSCGCEQPVCHSAPLRLRIILTIAVPPGFLDCILQGRNPGAKANASLLQDDSASSAAVVRSWYGSGCPVYRMATKAAATLASSADVAQPVAWAL